MTKSNEKITEEVAQEINLRCVNTLRVNMAYANTLHENGVDYAIFNAASNAIKIFMMHTIHLHDTDMAGATSYLMDFISNSVFKELNSMPGVGDGTELVMATADSLEELVEKITGMDEAEHATKQ